MRIAVCEDMKEEADWLCDTIRSWSLEKKLAVKITSYPDAASFSFALYDTYFDVLFLDIKMPGEDGVTLAKRLRDQANDMAIVFVTGEREYIMEGYEVEAVNYLLKPVQAEKVFQCLNRIWRKLHQEEPFILIKKEETTVKLLQREIYMVEVFSHKLVYTSEKGSFEVISSMKEARQKLVKEWFVMCYRGVLVNLLYIDYIGKNNLVLVDEGHKFRREVPVSRRLYAGVNEAFINFYRKHCGEDEKK